MKIIVRILFLICISYNSYAQKNDDINIIVLENQYARFIYNPIITLKRSGNEVLMYVEPCEYFRKKKKIKKCKDEQPYKVDPKKFNELVELVSTLKRIDLKRAELKMNFTDGHGYTIKYGNIMHMYSSTHYLPNINTSGRGLDNFLKACKMINKLAGLKL